MKKSIFLLAILLGSVQAADTTILTKATVKLIKNQDKVIGDLLDIRASLRKTKRQLEQQVKINKKITKNSKQIKFLDENVSVQSFQIQKLAKSIENLKKTINENNNSLNLKISQLDKKINAQAKGFNYATKGLSERIRKIQMERYIKYTENNCTLFRVSPEVDKIIDSYLK